MIWSRSVLGQFATKPFFNYCLSIQDTYNSSHTLDSAYIIATSLEWAHLTYRQMCSILPFPHYLSFIRTHLRFLTNMSWYVDNLMDSYKEWEWDESRLNTRVFDIHLRLRNMKDFPSPSYGINSRNFNQCNSSKKY